MGIFDRDVVSIELLLAARDPLSDIFPVRADEVLAEVHGCLLAVADEVVQPLQVLYIGNWFLIALFEQSKNLLLAIQGVVHV